MRIAPSRFSLGELIPDGVRPAVEAETCVDYSVDGTACPMCCRVRS